MADLRRVAKVLVLFPQWRCRVVSPASLRTGRAKAFPLAACPCCISRTLRVPFSSIMHAHCFFFFSNSFFLLKRMNQYKDIGQYSTQQSIPQTHIWAQPAHRLPDVSPLLCGHGGCFPDFLAWQPCTSSPSPYALLWPASLAYSVSLRSLRDPVSKAKRAVLLRNNA